MVRVAINGFGRIGRMVLRAGLDDKRVDFVAVNDLADAHTLAHLFKFDSAQGILDEEVEVRGDTLLIGKKKLKVLAEREPARLPWKKLNVDIVVESTGFFTKREDAAKHITAGARKVLISAPGKTPPDMTIVYGVNHKGYDKKRHNVIANASCTTNCTAPMVKVMDDNFEVKRAFLTTVHAYTSTQNIVDAPHKDLRRARAAALNIVPTTTGAAKAVEQVIPKLKGRLDGIAMRVPVAVGSITDLTCEVKDKVDVDKVNRAFAKAANKDLKGVLQYSEEPLVSTDIIGNPYSVIFDSRMTRVMQGNLVKILGWYDNEYGFSCRMIDVLKMM